MERAGYRHRQTVVIKNVIGIVWADLTLAFWRVPPISVAGCVVRRAVPKRDPVRAVRDKGVVLSTLDHYALNKRSADVLAAHVEVDRIVSQHPGLATVQKLDIRKSC